MDTSIVQDFEKLLTTVGDNLIPDLAQNNDMSFDDVAHFRLNRQYNQQSASANQMLTNNCLKRRRYKKRRYRRQFQDDLLSQNKHDVTDSDYDVANNLQPNSSHFDYYKLKDLHVENESMEIGDSVSTKNVKKKRRLKSRMDITKNIEMLEIDKMEDDFSALSSSFSSEDEDSDGNTLQSRDGDDEYSDTTISIDANAIIPWWEKCEEEETDSRLQNIMDNVFDNLPETSKMKFTKTLESLDNCHRNRMQSYKDQVKMRSIEDMEIVKIKRRKRQCGSEDNAAVHTNTVIHTNTAPAPLADDNIGFRMLKEMGWSNGEGLGVRSDGIVNPVLACMHKGRKGLGNMK